MRAVLIGVGFSYVLAVFTPNLVWAYHPYGHPDYGWPATTFAHAPSPANWGIHVEESLVADGYMVKIYLGKLRPEDVKITISPHGIALQSVQTSRFDQTQAHGYWYKQSYTQFSRLIPLPNDADTELASMDYRDGVLEVLLPRRK